MVARERLQRGLHRVAFRRHLPTNSLRTQLDTGVLAPSLVLFCFVLLQMVRRAFRTWDGRVLVESTGTFGALRTLVR